MELSSHELAEPGVPAEPNGQDGLQDMVKEVVEGKLKTGVSKYDFFKVKITSGTGESYSLLSRFMISRIFTSVGV